MDFACRLFAVHLLADLRASPRTVERYARVLRDLGVFLDTALGEGAWTFDDVTKDHLVRFLRGREHERAGSASTQNVRLAAVRTFFDFLVRQKMTGQNPATAIPFLQVKRREPTFLTLREYERLLRVVRRHTPPALLARNEAIVAILFNTGLRVSELASLTLDMLDMGTRAFRNVPLKGGRFGSVEWNRETERVLGAWLTVRKTWDMPKQVRALFVTKDGHALSVRAIQEMFAGYSRILRLGKAVTPHVLRHSMATELLRQGYDIRVIAGLLHHQSLNSTKRYAHLVDSLRREALASLEPGSPRRKRPGRR